jgi:hypothetical protein
LDYYFVLIHSNSKPSLAKIFNPSITIAGTVTRKTNQTFLAAHCLPALYHRTSLCFLAKANELGF